MRPFFFLVSLVLVSCATLSPNKPTGLTIKDFLEEQTRREKEAHRLSGKLGLRVENTKESASGGGRFLSELPNRFVLEFRDPLGRLHYVLSSNGAKVVAFYPRQKIAYWDAPEGRKYLERFLGLHGLSLIDLQSLWFGLLPKRWMTPPPVALEWDSLRGQYSATLKLTNARATLYLNANGGYLEEVWYSTEQETLIILFENFAPCCFEIGRLQNPNLIKMAQSVTVEMKSNQAKIEADWNDLKSEEKPFHDDSFEQPLPKDSKSIPLK